MLIYSIIPFVIHKDKKKSTIYIFMMIVLRYKKAPAIYMPVP